MSVVKDLFLRCDFCGATSASVAEGEPTAALARESAKAMDWHYGRGRDICELCWERGRR
jgi:hypothetical protein